MTEATSRKLQEGEVEKMSLQKRPRFTGNNNA